MTHHYFVSSVAEWKTGTNLEELKKHMIRSGFEFAIWKVPGDEDSEYEIRSFVPQVEGREYLGKIAP